VRPENVEIAGRYDCVSIHAPVRGATKEKSKIIYSKNDVSIHAPVRGATS